MKTTVNIETPEKEFDSFIDNAFISMCRSRNKVKHTVVFDDIKNELYFYYTDGSHDMVMIVECPTSG